MEELTKNIDRYAAFESNVALDTRVIGESGQIADALTSVPASPDRDELLQRLREIQNEIKTLKTEFAPYRSTIVKSPDPSNELGTNYKPDVRCVSPLYLVSSCVCVDVGSVVSAVTYVCYLLC